MTWLQSVCRLYGDSSQTHFSVSQSSRYSISRVKHDHKHWIKRGAVHHSCSRNWDHPTGGISFCEMTLNWFYVFQDFLFASLGLCIKPAANFCAWRISADCGFYQSKCIDIYASRMSALSVLHDMCSSRLHWLIVSVPLSATHGKRFSFSQKVLQFVPGFYGRWDRRRNTVFTSFRWKLSTDNKSAHNWN